MMRLLYGDCLKVFPTLPENSVDSIVTDPPYGISFMNKKWDYNMPSVEIWEECLRVLKPGGHLLCFASTRTFHRMVVNIEDAGFDIRDSIAWMHGQGFPKSRNLGEGRGTALKPAMELIAVARKPFKGSCTNNVEEWGTGGLNFDACRIGNDEIQINRLEEWSGFGQKERPDYTPTTVKGRFPANVILDEEAGEVLDGQNDGASRFFYCPKVNKKERGEGNNHPTVKPLKLMEYLCRLVTPKNGTVLDPFMGSGSTGKAAYNEAFDFIGIEMDGDYMEIAENRLEKLREKKKLKKAQ